MIGIKSKFSAQKAWKYLEKKTAYRPKIGIVLGSGLSDIGDNFPGDEFHYSQIPGMPESTVAGHKGILRIGPQAAVFLGRFHYYEGHPMSAAAFTVLLMKEMGIETVVLTNAAGGIKDTYHPGELVLINDHINFMGTNPFIGPHDPAYGPRFFDVTQAYDPQLRQVFQTVSKEKLHRSLQEGVYMAFTGPNYETPAEIRFAKTIGADLVGMSTVPEALAARSCGLRLAAISCVTNMAAGLGHANLDHKEVVEMGKKAEKDLQALLEGLVQTLSV